jgi:hypothetical protein
MLIGMTGLIPQQNLPTRKKKFFLLKPITRITITLMLPFFIMADIVAWFYQEIYFGLEDIPKIKRSNYIKVTRHRLKGLTPMQKWSCGYCEYANGVIAWIKAIVNQTEIYSCAIKYSHHYPGQEYQEKFYDQDAFKKNG